MRPLDISANLGAHKHIWASNIDSMDNEQEGSERISLIFPAKKSEMSKSKIWSDTIHCQTLTRKVIGSERSQKLSCCSIINPNILPTSNFRLRKTHRRHWKVKTAQGRLCFAWRLNCLVSEWLCWIVSERRCCFVSGRQCWICWPELVGLFIYISMMQSKGVVSETQVCVLVGGVGHLGHSPLYWAETGLPVVEP